MKNKHKPSKKKNKVQTKKSKFMWLSITIVSIIALLFLIGSVVNNSQGQSYNIAGDLSSNKVYTPVYTNTKCAVIKHDYTETYDWAKRSDSGGWITEYCSRNNHEVNAKKCSLEVQGIDGGTWSSQAQITELYVCPIGTTFNEKESKCDKLYGQLGTFSFTKDQFIIARARDFGGYGEVETGELVIKKVANWYGLTTIDSNNYLSHQETCDVSRIKDKGFTFLSKDKEESAPTGVLGFDMTMNYISAVTPTISKNIIQYNGKQVWTIGNQQYCNIKTDDEEIRFVDVTDCKTATKLICNPALPFCSDDGLKIINIDATGSNGKSCNELYGNFLGQFVPKATDPKQICVSECQGGKLVQTSCKAIPKCDIGTLNSKYECVTADVYQDKGDEKEDYFPLIAFGSLMLLLLILFAKSQMKKGGNQ